MNFLRRLFVVLLCLMLPLTGMAASGLAGAYAMPMPAAMADDPDCAPMADMPDCATMAQASSQASLQASPQAPSHPDGHGHSACKMTTQCQLGSLYHPTPAPAAYRHVGLASPVTFHYAQPLIVQRLDDFWRPPRVN
ncbi:MULTISPECIES: hypothetical protein [Pseudomonadota]|uniref:hypothetical protein n=1 Tax=Pseudomonadota TaxID=1224 RepID=UPI0014666644|nr:MULTISPECIES: hypothetical protein [Pseudomonadota]QQN75530.1 hypothetical protein JD971_07930 [Croceicoccus sp. YJ47]CAB3836360.1 hypothetical protein LMG3412_01013 [Achromobacter deleyi]